MTSDDLTQTAFRIADEASVSLVQCNAQRIDAWTYTLTGEEMADGGDGRSRHVPRAARPRVPERSGRRLARGRLPASCLDSLTTTAGSLEIACARSFSRERAGSGHVAARIRGATAALKLPLFVSG